MQDRLLREPSSSAGAADAQKLEGAVAAAVEKAREEAEAEAEEQMEDLLACLGKLLRLSSWLCYCGTARVPMGLPM